MDDLERARLAFATQVVSGIDASDRLRAAFAAVSRETFAGPPPWSIFSGSEYEVRGSSDARLLYQDVLIALAPDRRINNGQPSLHAACLAAVDPQPGESVLHVGAGTGYYTAILAELVGPSGRVIAHEIEGDLAAMAGAALGAWPQVRLLARSGTEGPFDPADVVYVSAGVTHPVAGWLDCLNIGGRLICPMTSADLGGAMLLVTRRSASAFAAGFLMRVGFIPCTGARSDGESQALSRAFAQRDMHAVRSLQRATAPDQSAWMIGEGWWLSTSE